MINICYVRIRLVLLPQDRLEVVLGVYNSSYQQKHSLEPQACFHPLVLDGQTEGQDLHSAPCQQGLSVIHQHRNVVSEVFLPFHGYKCF